MKYMGSKRSMLKNGLGEILRKEAASANRFADLFVGSAAVSWYVAENTDCRILAADLQLFAVSLAQAVIGRHKVIEAKSVWEVWQRDAERRIRRNFLYRESEVFDAARWEKARRRIVAEAREICAESEGTITRAYGGHYFSPKQALTLDALRNTLPSDPAKRSVALAALINAASECAAAPGHTAQPFQPTRRGSQFLFEAWRRNVYSHVSVALERICPKCARATGRAIVSDAETVAGQLRKNDVAFLDPPYSGVHYSRFYHVLETVARGTVGKIDGTGRYPAPDERPKSEYSIRSKSPDALDGLLAKLAEREVRTILTFPQEETSNGLSGLAVERIAKKYFKSSRVVVNGRFSTLGGNLRNRKARIPAYEIVLTLTPLH